MPEEMEVKAEEAVSPEEGNADKSAENQAGEVQETPEQVEEREGQERVAAEKAEAHQESSRLGRRLSAMEERMSDFLDQANQTFRKQGKEDVTKGLDEDENMTVGAFKKMLHQQSIEQADSSRAEKETQYNYGREYERELKNIGLSNDDEALHLKAIRLVTQDKSEFNVKSHKDPSAAAQINYLKALNHLKSGKDIPAKPNLKGDKNLPPAGKNTQTNPKTEPEIELNDEILDYMKTTNMSMEEAKKLLKR